jgi:ribosomal protein L29
MDETCPPPPCSDFDWLAKVLHVALRPLYELHVDTKALFAIARRVAVKWYWYPVAEGAVCEDKDRRICTAYRMFYRCSHEGKETYAMLEMNEDPEYGLQIRALIDREIGEKDVEELQPLVPELKIEMKEDAELKKCIEEVKKELFKEKEQK